MIRFVIAIAAFILAPATASWGAEWAPIGEEDSRIVLYAPTLDDASSSFWRSSEPHSVAEYGLWKPRWADYPRAQMYLIMLYPGMHYRAEGDVKKGVKAWNFLKNRDVTFGGEGSYSNVLGRGKYIEFVIDETQCFGFRQVWGQHGGVREIQGVPWFFYLDAAFLAVGGALLAVYRRQAMKGEV